MSWAFGIIALTVLALLGPAHLYMWRRLVRDVSAKGGLWRRTGTVLVIVLPLVMIANMVVGRSEAPFTLQRALAWPGYLWLVLMLYLLMALGLGEAVRPLLRRRLERRAASAEGAAPRVAGGSSEDSAEGGREAGDARDAETGEAAGAGEAADASRRLFVARTVAAGASLVAAGTVGSGAYNVLNGPTLKRVTVPLAALPRSAHGYRIAVVSDIHLGTVLGRGHTERIVRTINSAQPDLVAIVGDLVDGTVEDLGPAAEPLRRLRSRHGSFFVTGNHEYFGDAGAWVDHLRELDVHPLENARVELPGFDLAGVNDLRGEESGEGPDFGKALGDRDPARTSVLMAHQPVQIHEAVKHGVDLQLSGHTHGGQLFPFHAVVAMANPTVAGLERYGDTQLYVTRGAGAWGPPVRVGADPDVTIVRLASKQA